VTPYYLKLNGVIYPSTARALFVAFDEAKECLDSQKI